jgi:TRAP transporter TAXI family solute receptor
VESPADQTVGSSLPIPAIAASVLSLALIAAGFFGYRSFTGDEARHHVVIATGPESGTYHALGVALARVLETEEIVASTEVRTTGGSVENMDLIGALVEGADLAFVQGDTPTHSGVQLVTPLYEEVLHILVRTDIADEVDDITDLDGRRLSLGNHGSGTRQLSERVIDHFGVTPGSDVPLTPSEAAEGLLDGTLDALFVLKAIPSRLIDGLADSDAVRFVSLGDAQELGNEAEGISMVFPSIRSAIIPRATYHLLPQEPVSTISVSALLVADRDLDPLLVRDVTESIFENRSGTGGLEGQELLVARRIREDYRPASFSMAYHDGAVSYYRREDPAFFVEYAEAISLGLTLLVGLYSGYIALREWMRRRMKNRIDAYLLEVEHRSSDLHDLSLQELLDHRDALDEVRHRAFSDLVNERLYADESFMIFQNHLRDEFAAIKARIVDKKRSA